MSGYGKQLANQEERQYVFARVNARARRAAKAVEDPRWVDLYELLDVPSDAHPREIDEAIIERTADCLCFSFSRSSQKPDDIRLIEEHQPAFRPVLLNPAIRARYDSLREAHRARDESATDYATFLSTVDLTMHQGCMSVVMAVGALLSAALMLCRL